MAKKKNNKNNTKSNADKLREEFYKSLHELDMRLAKRDAEIDKLLKAQEKTDAQIAKTDKEIDKLRDSVRKVSDGYGRFVVGIISPSAVKYFSGIGYEVIGTAPQKTFFKDKVPFAEYDVFMEAALNAKRYIIIGEAKTHCSSTDIDEFIEKIKKLSEIEIYKTPIKIGFVAAVSYGEGADKYAIKNGLYVFKVTDELMEVQVPQGFIPTEF